MNILGSPNIKRLKQKRNTKKLIKILLNEGDIAVRREAARALGDFPDREVIDTLASWCKNDDQSLSAASLESMQSIIGKLVDNHSSDILIDLLDHKDSDVVRIGAAEALRHFKDDDVRRALMIALANEKDDYYFLKTVLESLKEIGNDSIVYSLNQFLPSYIYDTDDKYKDLYQLAMEVISKFDKFAWGKMLDAILQMLINEIDTDKQRIMADQLTQKLGEDPMKRLLFNLERLVGKGKVGKTAVGTAIGAFGEKAVEPLVDMMNNHENPNVRTNAAFALGETRSTAAVDPLMKNTSINGYIRTAALCNIGDKRAVEHVLDHIFSDPFKSGIFNIETRPDDLRPLFGRYADLLDCMVSDVPAGTMYINANLNQLCNLKTRVSSNILYKVKGVRDTQQLVDMGDYAGTMKEEPVTFNSMRETAEKELLKRKNPEYDPSAFTDESAW